MGSSASSRNRSTVDASDFFSKRLPSPRSRLSHSLEHWWRIKVDEYWLGPHGQACLWHMNGCPLKKLAEHASKFQVIRLPSAQDITYERPVSCSDLSSSGGNGWVTRPGKFATFGTRSASSTARSVNTFIDGIIVQVTNEAG